MKGNEGNEVNEVNKIKTYALLAGYSYPQKRRDEHSMRYSKFLFGRGKSNQINLKSVLLKNYKKVKELTTPKYVTFVNDVKKEVVLSIRGTDLTRLEENDLYTDALLIFKKEECRGCYKKLYENLKTIVKTYPKYRITLVGHSLGGRFAIDLLDSDLGKHVNVVHTFNCATAPRHLFQSAECFKSAIPVTHKTFCKRRNKLHTHIINKDMISILSLGDKSKTRKVHKGKSKKHPHEILNFY